MGIYRHVRTPHSEDELVRATGMPAVIHYAAPGIALPHGLSGVLRAQISAATGHIRLFCPPSERHEGQIGSVPRAERREAWSDDIEEPSYRVEEAIASLPLLRFHFSGGVSLVVYPKDYLVPCGSDMVDDAASLFPGANVGFDSSKTKYTKNVLPQQTRSIHWRLAVSGTDPPGMLPSSAVARGAVSSDRSQQDYGDNDSNNVDGGDGDSNDHNNQNHNKGRSDRQSDVTQWGTADKDLTSSGSSDRFFNREGLVAPSARARRGLFCTTLDGTGVIDNNGRESDIDDTSDHHTHHHRQMVSTEKGNGYAVLGNCVFRNCNATFSPEKRSAWFWTFDPDDDEDDDDGSSSSNNNSGDDNAKDGKNKDV